MFRLISRRQKVSDDLEPRYDSDTRLLQTPDEIGTSAKSWAINIQLEMFAEASPDNKNSRYYMQICPGLQFYNRHHEASPSPPHLKANNSVYSKSYGNEKILCLI